MTIENKPVKGIEPSILAKLILFHRNGLATHIFTMSPSAIYLEEQTISALFELMAIKNQAGKSDGETPKP